MMIVESRQQGRRNASKRVRIRSKVKLDDDDDDDDDDDGGGGGGDGAKKIKSLTIYF